MSSYSGPVPNICDFTEVRKHNIEIDDVLPVINVCKANSVMKQICINKNIKAMESDSG